MDKVLLIEDDRPIAELISYRLGKEGYTVLVAFTGSEGLRKAEDESVGLVLLDWSLPDISGLDICKQIMQTRKIPVIMVTARNLVEDKVLGLEAGADDYITKPFDLREVVARVRAAFRRQENLGGAGARQDRGVLLFCGLEVDTGSRTVLLAGKAVDLTMLEYNLLLYLHDNRNLVLTRDQMLNAVWGIDYYGNTRTVDIHVMRIRKKLNLDEAIQTVYKVGYKFIQ